MNAKWTMLPETTSTPSSSIVIDIINVTNSTFELKIKPVDICNFIVSYLDQKYPIKTTQGTGWCASFIPRDIYHQEAMRCKYQFKLINQQFKYPLRIWNGSMSEIT